MSNKQVVYRYRRKKERGWEGGEGNYYRIELDLDTFLLNEGAVKFVEKMV